MSDINKFINIVQEAEKGSLRRSKGDSMADSTTSIRHYVSLIEGTDVLNESFKDAKNRFVDESGDESMVDEYLEILSKI